MAAASVNGLGVWNILGKPLRHQFGEGTCPLKDPPQLVGDLAHGDGLLFHCIASKASLYWNRAVYPTISHTIPRDGDQIAPGDVGPLMAQKLRTGDRTRIYYCHPYSAYERGSNENGNRVIRRKVLKGTDFTGITEDDTLRVQRWVNEYPRGILGGRCGRVLLVLAQKAGIEGVNLLL